MACYAIQIYLTAYEIVCAQMTRLGWRWQLLALLSTFSQFYVFVVVALSHSVAYYITDKLLTCFQYYRAVYAVCKWLDIFCPNAAFPGRHIGSHSSWYRVIWRNCTHAIFVKYATTLGLFSLIVNQFTGLCVINCISSGIFLYTDTQFYHHHQNKNFSNQI